MFHFFFFFLALEGVLSICPNKCSGHGLCSKSQTCKCFDDWTGVDCSHRKCPSGPSWGFDPESFIECSGRGICDEQNGKCICDEGFTGKSCQVTDCPSLPEKGLCNGHGNCLSISALHYHYVKPNGDALEDSTLPYKNRFFGCMCNKGWYGYDCSERNCPIGAVENKDKYDTVSFYKHAYDISKFPYKIIIINCGEESDPMKQNNQYCRQMIIQVNNGADNKYLRDLIISKGIVSDIVIRFLKEDSADNKYIETDLQSSTVWEFNFVTDPYARILKVTDNNGNHVDDLKVESTTAPSTNDPDYYEVGSRKKQPKPLCLTDGVFLCHYQSVKTYKICSGNGQCDTSTGKCTCVTVDPNKYVLDDYMFDIDYVKSWNCQIVNSIDSPYKKSGFCNGKSQEVNIDTVGTTSIEKHPYCECDDNKKGYKCDIPTCFDNKANSWFSPVERLSVCSDMGKCDINKGCICRPGYESTDCSQMSCPNNCEPNGKCQSVHPGSTNKPILSECQCNKGYGGYNCSEVTCPFGVDIYDCDIDTEEPPFLQISCTDTKESAILKYNEREIEVKKSSKFSEVIDSLYNKFELKEEIVPFSCKDSSACIAITSLGDEICKDTNNIIHLRFYYYCNEDLDSYLVVDNSGFIDYNKGTRKCFECSNHGKCNRKDGSCSCVGQFASSNNRDRKGDVKVGQRGDCSYFSPYALPTKII